MWYMEKVEVAAGGEGKGWERWVDEGMRWVEGMDEYKFAGAGGLMR